MIKKPSGYSFNIADNWMEAFKFVNALLSCNITLVRNEEACYIPFDNILGSDIGHKLNQEEIAIINKYAKKYNVNFVHIDVLPSGRLLAFHTMKIGIYGGGGAPYNYGYGLSELGFDVYYINDTDIRNQVLKNLDVLIVPGGAFKAMYGQLQPLGESGIKEIVEFVRRGGMYIGSCAGSYDAAITPKTFTDTFPLQANMQMINAKVWNDGSNTEWAGLQSPGIGVIKVKKAVKNHPILWDLPEELEMTHYNGPIFETVENGNIEGASKALGLLSWSGYTDAFTPSEKFLDSTSAGDKLLADKAVEENRFAAVLGFLDRGSVLLFGSHPEFGFSITMGDMQPSYKIIANAILWKSSMNRIGSNSTDFDAIYLQEYNSNIFYEQPELIKVVNDKLEEICEVIEQFKNKNNSSTWLAKSYSMSLFGKGPSFIWEETMKENRIIIKDMQNLMNEISEMYANALGNGGNDELINIYRLWQSALLYSRDEMWDQDFGYQGVLKLLDMSKELFLMAYERYDTDPGEKPTNPYAQMYENPYILAVGVYCSASGALASAHSIMKMHKAKIDKYLVKEKISIT